MATSNQKQASKRFKYNVIKWTQSATGTIREVLVKNAPFELANTRFHDEPRKYGSRIEIRRNY